MKLDPNPALTQPTVEQGLHCLLTDAKRKVSESYQACQEQVRESPAQAMLLGIAAGYVLHRLPLRSLLVTQVRLAASLAPPALLLIGAAKMCEILHRQVRQGAARRSPDWIES